ncbi:MAG: ribonuclease HII [Patescibacteria group bacterium]
MKTPNFFFERKLWKKGFKHIAGVDEVGRGCFAGPVVAGCVIFENGLQIPENIKINDSKKLTPRQRERANHWIKENALSWGIGEVSASVINRLGMAKATKMAFRKAISEARKRLGIGIDFLLVDAFFIPYVRGNPKGRQMAIVDGDEKSISIGAASIIAKVYRDNLMVELGKKPKFIKYGWGKNKGYGTKEHQLAIKKYGITRYHRRAFVKNFA